MGDKQDRNDQQHPQHRSTDRPRREQESEPHRPVGTRLRSRPDEQCQHRVQHPYTDLSCRPRHRPGDRHPRRCRTGGRQRLRKTGQCPPTWQFGIYGQHRPGIYLAEKRTADRPGAGDCLRIHLRRRDLPGGRVCQRPHEHQRGPLRQVVEEHQQQPQAGKLESDDEERLLPCLKHRA